MIQGSIGAGTKGFVTCLKHPDQLWGPSILLPNGYWRLKQWGLVRVDHSPPSRAEVMNEWSYTCNPPPAICLNGVDGDIFTLSLIGKRVV